MAKSRWIRSACVALGLIFVSFEEAPARTVAAPAQGQIIHGFRVEATYLDADKKLSAVQFKHAPTAAPVFLLFIETVPQAWMWVDTPAIDSRGLPHSLEHLLAGRGTKGRFKGLLMDMSLSESGAATWHDFNYYHFHSGSGLKNFHKLFHATLEALYRPDFTDLEAEREFYHFAVEADASTGRRKLIEKGTVYNEMLTNEDRSAAYFRLLKLVLGDKNPLAYPGGGAPSDMREVKPAEIREFHRKHFRIGATTGFIFALDPDENWRGFLDEIDRELIAYQPRAPSIQEAAAERPMTARAPKYPFEPVASPRIEVVPYPAENQSLPSTIMMAWKPTRIDDPLKLRLLSFFMSAFSGGERSVLYRSVVEGSTREIESGATGVGSDVIMDQGVFAPFPMVSVAQIPGERISVSLAEKLRDHVLKKMDQVASYPDGSPALQDFNSNVRSMVAALQRSGRVWFKSPPMFGFYESMAHWKRFFEILQLHPKPVRSFAEEEVWKELTERTLAKANRWTEVVRAFGLLEKPHVVAQKPSTELKRDLEKKKEERLRAKTAELRARYAASDDQEALRRFEAIEAAKSSEIKAIEARVKRPRFVDNPPLSNDDSIRYQRTRIAGRPATFSMFDRPTTIDASIAFDIRDLPRRYYRYLQFAPTWLSGTGLKEDGKVLGYRELSDEILNRTYGLGFGTETNSRTGRAEFTVEVTGVTQEEVVEGFALARRMIRDNYLSMENLSRLQDLVKQWVSADEGITAQRESDWIRDPLHSFRNREKDLHVAIASQFTKAHWAERLSWALHDPVPADRVDELEAFARSFLREERVKAEPVKALAHAMEGDAKDGLRRELFDYLRKQIRDFPEEELVEGWGRLVSEVVEDLRQGPERTISEMRDLQRWLFARDRAHVSLMTNRRGYKFIEKQVAGFLGDLPAKRPSVAREGKPAAARARIGDRLAKRYPGFSTVSPVFLGFVHPEGETASVVFAADAPGIDKLDEATLADSLASRLFSGSGPHTFYMTTWDAGLAYGNGINTATIPEIQTYYADRVPASVP